MNSTTTEHADRLQGAKAASLMRLATMAAVATACVLIVIKAVAWWVTGSVALFGSLLDSVLDLGASAVNMVAVNHALTPADREHRFGHGKAEALAGLGQAVFIGASAAYLVVEAVTHLIEGTVVQQTEIGVVVIAVSIALTLGLVAFQRSVARRTGSLAITADSVHYQSDLLMNLAVIAALLMSGTFGIVWADPVLGLGIAGVIGIGAVRIVRQSYDQLMDRELDETARDRIKEIVTAHGDVLGIHDLRTRASGTNIFIQFHIELDPDMRLVEAHRIADEVEIEVMGAFPGAEVLIHQDPAGLEELTALESA